MTTRSNLAHTERAEWPAASCCGEPRVTDYVDRCYDHAKACVDCGQPSEDGTCPICRDPAGERMRQAYS